MNKKYLLLVNRHSINIICDRIHSLKLTLDLVV